MSANPNFSWYSGYSQTSQPQELQQPGFQQPGFQQPGFQQPSSIPVGGSYADLSNNFGNGNFVDNGTQLHGREESMDAHIIPISSGSSSSASSSHPSSGSSDPSNHPSDSSHPPSNTEKSTSTSSTNDANPLGVPAPGHSASNDQVHATPLSDKHDTVPPLSTPSSSTTMPAHGPGATSSSTPAAPATASAAPSTSAKPDKKKKEHKGIKERFHDWKAKRHGNGASASSDVHPKDSRTGQTLPSEKELAEKTRAPNDKGDDEPKLHKDAGDATGKSITGSDANPSKASMPFKVPEPAMKQAPVEAKAT